jgi:hypothetical protein
MRVFFGSVKRKGFCLIFFIIILIIFNVFYFNFNLNPSNLTFQEQLSDMFQEDNFRNELLKFRKEKNTIELNKQIRINRTKENPILIYSASGEGMWRHINFFSNDWTENCMVPCKFSKEIKDFEKSDIILNYETAYTSDLAINYPSKKPKKFAVLTLENFYRSSSIGADKYLERIYSSPRKIFHRWLSSIDILISTHQDSDVVVNYIYGLQMRDPFNHTPEIIRKHLMENFLIIDKKKDILASSWISNCNSNIRNTYIIELSKWMKIDHYGGCYNTGLNGRSFNKIQQQAKYKFILAFENTIQTDYMTEKYFEGLRANSVMIYFGAPNMHHFSPINGKIGINALEYTPKELANYLNELNTNDVKYLEYLNWRKKKPRESFDKVSRNDFLIKGKESWICRLCQHFHQRFD